jgi:hypothetical protein
VPKLRRVTPEKIRQRLERVSSHELYTLIESSLMLAASTMRSDAPDTEVLLKYGLEQTQYATYAFEELISRKEGGEFLRRLG